MTRDNSRLLAFGDRLRQLRKAAKITGTRLAELAGPGWQPSKVSRLENGQQLITDEDLITWCAILELPEAERQLLRDELRGIRLDEARWKRQLRTGHEVVQQSFSELERAATHIRNFETALVPGLLQTPDYARAVFTAMATLKATPNDAAEAVNARMRRQGILYDTGKRIELLVTEAALRTPIAPPDVMAGQLDRLLGALGLPNVRFGIIPLGERLPYPTMHGFWILDDLVNVEVINTSMNTRDPADLELYTQFFEALWEHAAEGDSARSLLLAVAVENRPSS